MGDDYTEACEAHEQAKVALDNARYTLTDSASNVADQLGWMLQNGKIKCKNAVWLRFLEGFLAAYEDAVSDRNEKIAARGEVLKSHIAARDAAKAGTAEAASRPQAPSRATNAKVAFHVHDVDDIGTSRLPVCAYAITEMLEAFDHADNRGGYMTNHEGAVVYVSPKADLSAFKTHTLNEKAYRTYASVITWIGENQRHG